MIKVRMVTGEFKDEEGLIAGFIVKEENETYAIVIIAGSFEEVEICRLEFINN